MVQIEHLKCEISEQQKRITKTNGKVGMNSLNFQAYNKLPPCFE